MSALMDLLNKAKKDASDARSQRTADLAKFKSGDNFIRIFPNKDDPENGIFYHKYGIHYAKTQSEDGKDGYAVHICAQHTHDKPCELCEMVMEGRARAKGNKALEERIAETRAAARFVVVGLLSTRSDFSDVEKTQLIDVPQTVFEDLTNVMAQDFSDEIGNPLSKDNGYSFLVKREGSGRDTRYTVTPQRKSRSPIAEKYWNEQPDMLAFVNQSDPTKLLQTARAIGRIAGIAAPSSLSASAAIAAPASVAGLPGFGSVTGHSETEKVASVDEVKASSAAASLIEEELEHAKDVVFEPTPEKEPSKPEEANSADIDFEAELAELAKLGSL